tara:strand:+ start:182 stop:952 length:771 start_codon:yes stop_codon:yes gene_type:complete
MSIKTLLQIILFLLIILIIGGIYFLYFYKGPISNKLINTEIEKVDLFTNENTFEESILEEENLINKNNLKKKSDFDLEAESQEILVSKKKNNQQEIIQGNTQKKKTHNKKKNTNQIENLTKEIEYITSNSTGEIYKISAKFGKTNPKDNNILDLDQVNGTISSTKRSKIFISSDFAEYNYTNQDSKFYTNVEIKYDSNIIICDNLEIKMSKNIAIAYGNVLLKNEKSEMKAQIITLDLITKDININSNEGISLITN